MKRLLICDDEPHIVEGLRYLLRGPDREIDVATNGVDALERIRAAMPDLLILDVMMPKMNGLEVLSALRLSAETQYLPIIILTAKGQARDAAMAQEMWDATVMAKPFEPRRLQDLVRTVLERSTCPTTGSS
jgi:DNA-binding response OmpR family regulator